MMVLQLLRGQDAVRSPFACPTVNNDMPEVSWESKIPVSSTFYLFIFLPIYWSSLCVESKRIMLSKSIRFRAWLEF